VARGILGIAKNWGASSNRWGAEAPPLTRNSLGFEGICCGDIKAAAARGMVQAAATGGRRRR